MGWHSQEVFVVSEGFFLHRKDSGVFTGWKTKGLMTVSLPQLGSNSPSQELASKNFESYSFLLYFRMSVNHLGTKVKIQSEPRSDFWFKKPPSLCGE